MITPKVMSKAISIPGSLVVIGALIGGTLLGLLGALVAVPVTASILLIIKQVFIPGRTRSLATSPPAGTSASAPRRDAARDPARRCARRA